MAVQTAPKNDFAERFRQAIALIFVGAKHSGEESFGQNQQLIIRMLRPHSGSCLLWDAPAACETNRAETLLSTLSFQSTVCPERHVWIDTDLGGIGIDLEDWNVEEEWDNAAARIRVDSLEEAVEIVRVWLSGENLDSYANLNKEYDKILKIAPASSSKQ